VQRFRHHARQFLEPRVTVKLERVEAAALLAGRRCARLQLAVRLNFEFPQLVAQPQHAIAQVAQRLLDDTQLALESRPRNGNFPRFIDEPVECIGLHDDRAGVGRARRPAGGRTIAFVDESELFRLVADRDAPRHARHIGIEGDRGL